MGPSGASSGRTKGGYLIITKCGILCTNSLRIVSSAEFPEHDWRTERHCRELEPGWSGEAAFLSVVEPLPITHEQDPSKGSS